MGGGGKTICGRRAIKGEGMCETRKSVMGEIEGGEGKEEDRGIKYVVRGEGGRGKMGE